MKTIPPNAAQAAAADRPMPTAMRMALGGLSLSMLMPSLDTGIANASLPTLAQAFGASFHAVQWIVLAYLLAVTATIAGVGRLGDLLGRRRLLLAGIVLFSLASLLCGAAPALWCLLGARAAQGFGAAVMLALATACVSDLVPANRTGRAMGLLGTMSAVGTTLGPALGGLLSAGLGWRAIFFVNLPLGMLTFFLVYRFLPAAQPTKPAARGDFDSAGMLVLSLSLAAYALALTTGGGFGVRNLALLALAALGLALFVRIEARVVRPLIALALFREHRLRAGLAMSMLVATVMMATLVVGPFYLARAFGLQAAALGLALAAGPLAAAFAGLPAGRLVDRFGAQRTTVVALAGMAVACGLLCAAPASLGAAGYLAPVVGLTSCYALFQTANNTAVMTGLDAGRRGAIAGLLSLARNLGLISGAAALGAMFAFASGAADMTAAQPAAIATGRAVTFGVAALLIAVALLVALGASRRRAAASVTAP